MLNLSKEINDYGYSVGMDRYFMFKDPKAGNHSITVDEYQMKVINQVTEDLARLYCCEALTINMEEITNYIEDGYSIVGIKILISDNMMHPMFYRFTKWGRVRRKNLNMKVQNFKKYPKNIGIVKGNELTTVDYFIAYKEAA